MFIVDNKGYEVVFDHRNGWNFEMFRDRYSDILGRYDFIAGDWGYNQLRLRGFYAAEHPQANKENSIATFQDYIAEYCNFGCPYFLIQKVKSAVEETQLADEQDE